MTLALLLITGYTLHRVVGFSYAVVGVKKQNGLNTGTQALRVYKCIFKTCARHLDPHMVATAHQKG